MRAAPKSFLFAATAATALLLGTHHADATTMTATLCDINVGAAPCPLADTLDFGVRFNNVPLLGINRWAVLPFTFSDASAGITGNIFVVDIAGSWIYLYGQGVAAGNNAAIPLFLNVAITQNYITTIPAGTFIGVDGGFCNPAATVAGSGQTGFPFVNNVAIAPNGGNTTACPAFLQTFGPQVFGLGAVTNLTAVASFNLGLGGGQLITLPWGDDFPDPFAPDLNHLFGLDLTAPPAPGSDPTPSTIISALNAMGLVQQIPEPATLALFGAGLVSLAMIRRRRHPVRTRPKKIDRFVAAGPGVARVGLGANKNGARRRRFRNK
jgi:hypothetical protein